MFVSCAKYQSETGGKTIVLSGPTAVGKDAILRLLPNEIGEKTVRRITTISTKKPRQCEENSHDYNYVSEQAFQKMVAHNELIEHTQYCTGSGDTIFFGTPTDQFISTQANELVFWKVSPDRLLDIIQLTCEDCLAAKAIVPVYLGTSNLRTLLRRAQQRASNATEWLLRLEPNFRKRIRAEYEFWKKNEQLLSACLLLNDGSCDETITSLYSMLFSKLSDESS